MKLLIGNKAYSSWSMRGWLACLQSDLPFEEEVIPLYDATWGERRLRPDLAPSNARLPLLYDDHVAVWESLAIVEHLADIAGSSRFWPEDRRARGHARSIAAEMHAGFAALRRQHPTNYRRAWAAAEVTEAVATDLDRITTLWRQARELADGEGPYLYGGWGAADIMYAPVVSRILTYDLPVAEDARAYCDKVRDHPHVARWYDEAAAEPWVIAQYERDDTAAQ